MNSNFRPPPIHRGHVFMDPAEAGIRRQAFGHALDHPILNVLGWIFVLYVLFYVLAAYVSPAIFGTRPYRPYYYRRSLNDRPVSRILTHMDEAEAIDLTARVTQAIQD